VKRLKEVVGGFYNHGEKIDQEMPEISNKLEKDIKEILVCGRKKNPESRS
jgi:hypothetical protein